MNRFIRIKYIKKGITDVGRSAFFVLVSVRPAQVVNAVMISAICLTRVSIQIEIYTGTKPHKQLYRMYNNIRLDLFLHNRRRVTFHGINVPLC